MGPPPAGFVVESLSFPQGFAVNEAGVSEMVWASQNHNKEHIAPGRELCSKTVARAAGVSCFPSFNGQSVAEELVRISDPITAM